MKTVHVVLLEDPKRNTNSDVWVYADIASAMKFAEYVRDGYEDAQPFIEVVGGKSASLGDRAFVTVLKCEVKS